MAKEQYVADVGDGMEVRSRFFVREARQGSGKAPHKLTLGDRSGTIAAICWPSSGIEWEALRAAEFAEVVGVAEFSDYIHDLQVRIDGFSPIAEPGDRRDFLPTCPADRELLWSAFEEIVGSVREPALHALLDRLFADAELRRAYGEAPAAQRMHHPYIGGLLEHSIEVARLCDGLARSLPTVHRDLVVTAALLHDLGKVEEISYGRPAFGLTRAGGMLGHVFLGAERIRAAFRAVSAEPSVLSDALCHLILSHHGKAEFGAPVTPCLLEGYVLHACDDLSAKSYYCREAASKRTAGSLFQKAYGLEGRVFVEALSPCAVECAPDPPAAAPTDTDGDPHVLFLPLLGSVAAGVPTAEQQDVEQYLPLPADRHAREGDFLLRVRGDSMVGDHILDGDLLLVRPDSAAAHGDIVVALVDNESTVKRLLMERGGPVLRAANPAYADIHATEELVVQGKVVGVMRYEVG